MKSFWGDFFVHYYYSIQVYDDGTVVVLFLYPFHFISGAGIPPHRTREVDARRESSLSINVIVTSPLLLIVDIKHRRFLGSKNFALGL